MGLVSPASLNDAYYVLGKLYGERWARAAVGHLLDLLVVLPLGPEESVVASESNEPDFGDGMVRAAAELNDVSFILTRDKAAFNGSTVRKLTCREYLDIVESERRAATTRKTHASPATTK